MSSLALLALLAAQAADLQPRAPLPDCPVIAPDLPGDAPLARLELRVKFRDDAHAREHDQQLVLAQGTPRDALDDVISAHQLRFRPLIRLPARTLTALEGRAEQRSGVRAPDLAGMMIVELPTREAARLEAAGEALQTLSVVEYAHIALVGAPPPADIAPPTPDYFDLQSYLGPDPGVDALAAWELGFTGAAVRLSDCEYGWESTHEDLEDRDLHPEDGQTVDPLVIDYGYDSHGTAVMGELAAVDNDYGVTGGVHGASIYTFPEYTVEEASRRVTAITHAIADSSPGDVVLLEMQTITRPGGSYGPAELDPDVWTVVRTGTDAGVIVVGAAGNGAEDLDSTWYQSNYADRGDSGAILVGAGSASVQHSPLYFTTYGERVNLQGWGESVFTLGYGDYATLGGDDNQAYTSGFSGTSSASPIVSTAAVLVQDYAISTFGAPLSPGDMRALLIDTGLAQGAGVTVGPLPDVAAAIAEIDTDGDGWIDTSYGGEDCEDEVAQAHPGATETWYDGVDGDCDGGNDYDVDGDGYEGGGGDDCDDTDPDVHPGASEVWYDGVDGDCSGGSDSDADGDGYDGAGGEDCDDTNVDIHPGAVEMADGVDNDCDGQIDEQDATPPPSGDDDDGARACGCASGGAGSGGLGLLLLPLITRRRR